MPILIIFDPKGFKFKHDSIVIKVANPEETKVEIENARASRFLWFYSAPVKIRSSDVENENWSSAKILFQLFFAKKRKSFEILNFSSVQVILSKV